MPAYSTGADYIVSDTITCTDINVEGDAYFYNSPTFSDGFQSIGPAIINNNLCAEGVYDNSTQTSQCYSSVVNPPPYPVTSVNNKKGAVTLNYTDVAAGSERTAYSTSKYIDLTYIITQQKNAAGTGNTSVYWPRSINITLSYNPNPNSVLSYGITQCIVKLIGNAPYNGGKITHIISPTSISCSMSNNSCTLYFDEYGASTNDTNSSTSKNTNIAIYYYSNAYLYYF